MTSGHGQGCRLRRRGGGEWEVWLDGEQLYHRGIKSDQWVERDWQEPPHGYEMKEEGGRRYFKEVEFAKLGPPPGWTVAEVQEALQNRPGGDR